MTKEQQQVREFMLKAGQDCPIKPTKINRHTIILRLGLITEELGELADAFGMFESSSLYSHEKVADAIGDLLVVVLGTAVACGINIQPIWDEIHRSNMTKFIDGYRREDGKWIKGPSYTPANLKPIIKAQQNAKPI